MTRHRFRSSSRSGRLAALAGLCALLATLLVASPASAATFCAIAEDGSANLLLDETDGSTVVVSMNGDAIVINGAECGVPEIPANPDIPPQLNIHDEGDAKVDRVVFDLAQPFRVGDRLILIQLFVDADRDVFTVRGTGARDLVRLTSTNLTVDTVVGASTETGLFVSLRQADIDVNVDMRGGNDQFSMRQGLDGAWFTGGVRVKGQAGNDTMRGGPGAQLFIGGKGADTLVGAAGNDDLRGGGGRDTLVGGGGNDSIRGGGGIDTARGKAGADTFRMRDGRRDTVNGGKGRDACVCDANDRVRSIRDLTS